MAHPARRASRSLQYRGTPVNRKLCLAGKNDKHLLALIVEVGANPAFGFEDAPMHEQQVGIESMIASLLRFETGA
jgi:hypothetical protein